jgi:hypothetical protein
METLTFKAIGEDGIEYTINCERQLVKGGPVLETGDRIPTNNPPAWNCKTSDGLLISPSSTTKGKGHYTIVDYGIELTSTDPNAP